MTTVSIIILNWNGKTFLQDCLDSIAAQTFHDFETILVDNGSRDGSPDYVRSAHPWVRLLELPENVGFADGNNRGLAIAQGSLIVTLNNDTRVEPEFLAELVKAVEADPCIGMVAAKMLNFYDAGRLDSIGLNPTIEGLGVSIGIGEDDKGQYNDMYEVFGPCAGAALYRRSMLDETGFFDSDFFAYYEDLDLAWRGRLAGWRGVTASQALVYHVHSATGGRMSPFTVYHVQRNKWYVLLKNWPTSILLRNMPRILVYDAAALLLALLRGQFVPAIRARRHVIRELPSLLQKRGKVARLRLLSDGQIEGLIVKGASPFRIFLRKMGSGV